MKKELTCFSLSHPGWGLVKWQSDPMFTSILIQLKQRASGGLEECLLSEFFSLCWGASQSSGTGRRTAQWPCLWLPARAHPSWDPTHPARPQHRSKAAHAHAIIHLACVCLLHFKATLANVWDDFGLKKKFLRLFTMRLCGLRVYTHTHTHTHTSTINLMGNKGANIFSVSSFRLSS